MDVNSKCYVPTKCQVGPKLSRNSTSGSVVKESPFGLLTYCTDYF